MSDELSGGVQGEGSRAITATACSDGSGANAGDGQQNANPGPIETTPAPISQTLELSPSSQVFVTNDFESVSDIPGGTTSQFALGMTNTWQVNDQAGDAMQVGNMPVGEDISYTITAPNALPSSGGWCAMIATTDLNGQYQDPIGFSTDFASSAIQYSQTTYVNQTMVSNQTYDIVFGPTPSSTAIFWGTSSNGQMFGGIMNPNVP